MRRDIEKDLSAWKNDPKRKPLLLRGARQVGKTFVIRKLAEQFPYFVEINFEKRPDLSTSFEHFEPKKILQSIELKMNCSIHVGKTLLFLDEIQDCPRAISALRYFKEELPQLHIIGAGSLLEFVLNDVNFRMPVGRVQFLHLYPLSFFEFLTASSKEKLREHLQSISLNNPIEKQLHQDTLDLVKQYMLLGGMPDVLNAFFQTDSYQNSQNIQTDLLASYRGDFSKYAKTSEHKHLELLFQRAPGLIAQWFKYTKVDPHIQSRDLKKALIQLSDAGLVHLVHASSAQNLPLISQINEKKFKVLFLDVGLVHRAMRMNIESLLHDNITLINRGDIAEQFVGQELLCMFNPREKGRLFFWVREAKSSSAEIDYVMNIEAHIVPIEVKAGSTGRMRSLHRFMQEKKSPFGLRICENPLSLTKDVLSVPFYLVQEIPRLIKQLRYT